MNILPIGVVHISVSLALAGILLLIYRRLSRIDFLLYWAIYFIDIAVNIGLVRVASPALTGTPWEHAASVAARSLTVLLIPSFPAIMVCAALSASGKLAGRTVWRWVTASGAVGAVMAIVYNLTSASPEGASRFTPLRSVLIALGTFYFAWRLASDKSRETAPIRPGLIVLAAIYGIHLIARGLGFYGPGEYPAWSAVVAILLEVGLTFLLVWQATGEAGIATRELTDAEAALREREHKLRVIFDSHQDIQALIRVEPGDRFISEAFNRAMVDYCSCYVEDPNQYLERPRTDILKALGMPESEIAGGLASWRMAAEQKAPAHNIFPITIGPGKRKEIIDITVVPILDRNGACTHLLWTGRLITDKVNAEAELRKRAEELSDAQSIGHIGSWTAEIEQHKVTWSDELFRILGLEPQQFTPSFETFLARVHPDDRAFVERATRDALAKLEPHDIEHRIVRPDGTVRILHDLSRIDLDEAGKPIRMLGTLHDVTEEREAAARETERLHRLRRLSELSMMLSGEPSTVFERVVRIIGELFGLNVVTLSEVAGDELIYRAVYANGRVVCDAGNCPMGVSPCRTVVETENVCFYEGVQERFPLCGFLRDYHAYSYCGFPAFDNAGKVVATVCMLDVKPHRFSEEDLQIIRVICQRIATEIERGKSIAERGRMEARMRENEQRMQEAQRMASLGSYHSADPASGLMEWSEEMYRIFESDPADGPPGLDLVFSRAHPDDRAALVRKSEEVREGLGAFDIEHRLLMADGRVKYVLVQGRTIVDAAGKPAMRGTVQDITERRLAEQERERLREQLVQSQKMESIGRLAGGVAHDFNNLLTVVNGYSSALLDRMDSRHPDRGALESIRHAGENAAELVRQLLAFSRGQQLKLESISLNETVASLRPMLGRLVREDVDVICRLTTEPDFVMADRNQIERVIVNLAANARDAMPRGGTLTLETRRCRHSKNEPRCETFLAEGDYLALIVRDTGIGMDIHTREHLFEPFFSTRNGAECSGLGLSIVHGIVSQSGGSVSVESEPGKGTSLYVYLPAAPVAGAGRLRPNAARAEHGREAILLVEDKREVRDFIADVLRNLEYDVVEAPNADDALALLPTRGFDLLLTDMVMPGMSGLELAERARALQSDMRVLLMSGYPGHAAGDPAGGVSPAIAFQPKPFTPRILAAKVREVLAGARAGELQSR